MLCTAIATVMSVASVCPPPNETPTAIPSEKECSVITADHEQDLARAGAADAAELDLATLERLAAEDDEDQAERGAAQRLRHAVAGALEQQPDAGAEHEAGGDGIRDRHRARLHVAHEQERNGAEPGGERGEQTVEEDEAGLLEHALA